MILFHYTAGPFLREIAQCGLTVGDVPTDIHRNLGRVGVWLTSSEKPTGHGLENAKFDKKKYRLAIEIPESDPRLERWAEWGPRNATAATVAALHGIDAAQPETWWRTALRWSALHRSINQTACMSA
jgi:hypothetical protein